MTSTALATEVVDASPGYEEKTETSANTLGFKARDFLLPLASERKRPKSWPDKITFEKPKIMSVNEFRALLEKYPWRTAYHCEGKPVTSGPGFYDGIHHGFQISYYDRNFVRDSYSKPSKQDEDTKFRMKFDSPKTARYIVKALGDNKFEVSYPDGDFVPQIKEVSRVVETGELVILNGESLFLDCSGAKPSHSISVPLEVATT